MSFSIFNHGHDVKIPQPNFRSLNFKICANQCVGQSASQSQTTSSITFGLLCSGSFTQTPDTDEIIADLIKGRSQKIVKRLYITH